ncbi:MAG: OmpA family protein [Bacteroidota bacterium]
MMYNFSYLLILPFLLFSFTFQAQILFFSPVQFDTDQDTLTLEEKEDFEIRIKNLGKPITHYKIHLIGHTDNQGSLSYNEDLSRRRAVYVQSILTDLGLPQEQIQLEYRAFLSPTDKADNEAARTKNRRVDILLEPWLNHVSHDFHIVNAQQETILAYSRSTTKITIPSNAFLDRNGKPYEGEVLVSYREFQDYADFMMSDLPMNFNWEGEKAYFNSTGMFEMRAYDTRQQPLTIAPEKRIKVALEQREVLDGTEIWMFNEENKEWQSGNNFVRLTDEETVKVQSGSSVTKLGESKLWFPENTPSDTIKSLQDAHVLLGEIFSDIASYDNKYVPQLDFASFRDRTNSRISKYYAGTDYVRHLPFNLVYDNLEYYNIRLEEQGEKEKRKLRFKVNDLSKKNPELASLEEVIWEMNPAKFEKKYDFDLTSRRYADIKITRGRKGKYTFRLKYKGTQYGFEAAPKIVPNADDQEFTIAKRYRLYSSAYRERLKAFDSQIVLNRSKATLIASSIQLLMPKEVPNDEQLLDAMRYFLGKKRSYSNITLPPRGLSFAEATAYRFLCEAGRFFKPQLNRGYLNRAKWQALMDNYDPEFVGDVPIYVEMYIALESPVPILEFGGLGIFNLDVLKRFKEEKRLLASYRTPSGERLALFKVEIINHRLNGLLRFTGDEIYVDLGSPTTIVAHGVDGKIYYFSPQDFEQINLRREDTYTFVMQELGDYQARPELIRDLLANAL